jgi:hypothetical protein
MKAAKFKKISMSVVLVFVMSILSVVHGEDILLPIISKPAVLNEGTQVALTDAQIAELLPWVNKSKIKLNELLVRAEEFSSEERINFLLEGIQLTVNESSSSYSELLMKFTLNRAVVVNQILNDEIDPGSVGLADVRLRVLTTSIKMAIEYVDSDIATLSGKEKVNYGMFGKYYFNFLNELNKSIYDTSAQYDIQRSALEWLQWDLYRDLNNAKYGPAIIKINKSLKEFPESGVSDQEAISKIRLMKKIAINLELTDSLLVNKMISPRINKANRELEINEKVFYDIGNKVVTVVKKNNSEDYNVIDSNGKKIKGAERALISVLSGCGKVYCVNDQLIYTHYKTNEKLEATIYGIVYNGGYLVRLKKNNELAITVSEYGLSHSTGCRSNVCVGDKVFSDLNGKNQKAELEVVGLGLLAFSAKKVNSQNDDQLYDIPYETFEPY